MNPPTIATAMVAVGNVTSGINAAATFPPMTIGRPSATATTMLWAGQAAGNTRYVIRTTLGMTVNPAHNNAIPLPAGRLGGATRDTRTGEATAPARTGGTLNR